jgi:hypothetical protein
MKVAQQDKTDPKAKSTEAQLVAKRTHHFITNKLYFYYLLIVPLFAEGSKKALAFGSFTVFISFKYYFENHYCF